MCLASWLTLRLFFLYTLPFQRTQPLKGMFEKKKERKKGWINSQRLMNFILFLKKRKVCHTRQREREEMQTAINRPQDPHQRHPSTGGKVASRYNQNQRSNTTRLTLFWLCLLALKTSDDLIVQSKTDSFFFPCNLHMNNKNSPLVCHTFSRRYKWNRNVYGYTTRLIT